ncbi:MAG: hypothetical protein VW868_06990, partial [Bacteroidota bacterium]
MKTFRFLSIAILIGIGLLTTGCYTQMHLAYEWDQPTASGTSSYYSWDDDEQSQKGYNWAETTQTANPNYSSEIDEAASVGIYYKDYETEQWYDDHYVESLSTFEYDQEAYHESSNHWDYYRGYDKGYDRGYRKGYRDGWYDDDFWSTWYAKRWWRINFGWWGDHYEYYS